MLEWSVVNVSRIAMRDRVQEGRDLPSHIVEVIEPSWGNGISSRASIRAYKMKSKAHMKCMASLKDLCLNEAESRVLAYVSRSVSRIVPFAARWRRKRASDVVRAGLVTLIQVGIQVAVELLHDVRDSVRVRLTN